MNKSQQAINYMNTGHTCCEAVLYAYRQQTGLDEKMVHAIGSGFGSGMGGRQATCGALIGAVIVQGFRNHSDQPTKFIASKMERRFQEQCGATICHDIKDRIAARQLSSCNECVQHAVEILESPPEL